MSVYQTEAFTLRTYPYAEIHKVVVFLTRDYGIVRGMAHGAKHSRSRFGSALEPLTQLRLTFQLRANQDLAVIQQTEIIRAFPAYRLSWEVNLHFSYFAELLSEFGNEQEPSEKLFRLTAAVLDACARIPIRMLARYFELWLLKLEGILPGLDQRLPAALAEKATAMMKLPPSQLDEVTLESEELDQLERFSQNLIEGHLEKALKTRKMLRELL